MFLRAKTLIRDQVRRGGGRPRRSAQHKRRHVGQAVPSLLQYAHGAAGQEAALRF
jgi:hypothetical protein